MIVAALALDWFDNDRADVDLAFVDVIPDFLLRFFLARNDVLLALVFRQSKIDVGTGHARPLELGEQIRLPRIRISQAHGVTTATMKGVTEMQNLRSALAVA